MTREQLIEQIRKKQSFLCLGLDTEMSRLPAHLLQEEYPVFAFNRQIIDATHDLVIAYKPNVAFYECLGTDGWKQLELTVAYIRSQVSRYSDHCRRQTRGYRQYFQKICRDLLSDISPVTR